MKMKFSNTHIYEVISVIHFDQNSVFWLRYLILQKTFLKFIVNVNILFIFDFISAKNSILPNCVHPAEV